MTRPAVSPFVRMVHVLLVAALLVGCQALAATYTIVADRDAYVKEDKANENNDTNSEVDLKSNASNGNRRRPLFGFTLPAIPSDEYISSATLQLYVSREQAITAYVHRVTDSWTESTVTWNNTGSDYDATAAAQFSPATVNTTVSISITALAEGWRAGTYANNGVMILSTVADTDVKFRARETGTAAQRPQLVITTARIVPALTVVKSRSIVSDPYNGTTNPKAIPGALMNYNISVTNANAGTADSGTTIITDAVPSTMRLYVNDLGGAGSGPATFTNGSPTSGLSYTFTSLASTTDSIAFSNNGGSTYTYTPVPDANGYDSNVTHVRITPTGTFAGNMGSGSPSFQLQLRMQVR